MGGHLRTLVVTACGLGGLTGTLARTNATADGECEEAQSAECGL